MWLEGRLITQSLRSWLLTLWKKRDSNLPAFADVVVTAEASCPPPTTTCSSWSQEDHRLGLFWDIQADPAWPFCLQH